MAQKGLTGISLYPVKQTDEGDVVIAAFQFVGNDASSPTITLAAGAVGDFVSSVTLTSTGLYTITMRQACYKYLSVQATVQTSVTTNTPHWNATIVSTTPTSGTFSVRISKAVSGTAPSLANMSTTESLHCLVVMKQKTTSRLRA